MKRSVLKLAPTLVFGALLATSALAADLTKDQVKAKLEAAGYTKVSGIHKEKDHFDAKAMKDGKAVMLDVDASTGEITTESKDAEAHEHKDKY